MMVIQNIKIIVLTLNVFFTNSRDKIDFKTFHNVNKQVKNKLKFQ